MSWEGWRTDQNAEKRRNAPYGDVSGRLAYGLKCWKLAERSVLRCLGKAGVRIKVLETGGTLRTEVSWEGRRTDQSAENWRDAPYGGVLGRLSYGSKCWKLAECSVRRCLGKAGVRIKMLETGGMLRTEGLGKAGVRSRVLETGGMLRTEMSWEGWRTEQSAGNWRNAPVEYLVTGTGTSASVHQNETEQIKLYKKYAALIDFLEKCSEEQKATLKLFSEEIIKS